MTPVKKRLLVLGAGGLLGSEFLSKDYLPGWEVVGHGRATEMSGRADLSKTGETIAMLEALKPDALLNLVGLTNVDHCESFPDEAYIGNVKTLENVVAWIKQADKPVHLVHISTDQIYDGVGPHLEENISLKNYYAFSKYAGELVAASVEAAVLRTNFFGKSKCSKRTSLTDWLYSALSEGKHIQVFEDVMFSPLFMPTLCQMIALVVEKRISGTYNLGARDGLSKADLAYRFAGSLGLDDRMMTRSSTAEVDFLKTYRPKDMRLDVQHFECAAGVTLPRLVDEIDKAAREYLK